MTHAAAALPAPATGADAEAGKWVRADLLLGAALALFAVLVFANALSNGFALDDRGILLGNPLVQDLSQGWRAFTLPYWPEALGGGQYRPLGVLHFAFDWRISGGDAAWFHAINIVWHALATVLVWRLARQLMSPSAALICAALFAVHPVHVEAVANVVGRLECMATAFALGALLSHRASSWSAVPLFALGLLSKENAIVSIGLIVANDLLLPAVDNRNRTKLYAAYCLVVFAYVATLTLVFDGRQFHVMSGTLADLSIADRLWTVLTVIPHYARLLLIPASLSADYEAQVLPAAHGFTAPGAIGVLIAATYATALFIAWSKHRTLAFALLWIGIAIAPVANVFFVSGVTLAERSLYLPSVGAMLALGVAFDVIPSRHRRIALAAAAAALAAGAVRTWTRTPAWHDDRAYLMTLLTDHPESYRAHWLAGRVHGASGRYPEALLELARARELYPKSIQTYLDAAAFADRANDKEMATALRDSAAALRQGRPR